MYDTAPFQWFLQWTIRFQSTSLVSREPALQTADCIGFLAMLENSDADKIWIPKNGGYERWFVTPNQRRYFDAVNQESNWCRMTKASQIAGFIFTDFPRSKYISIRVHTLYAFHLLILSAPSGMPDLLPPHSSQLWGELAVNGSVPVLCEVQYLFVCKSLRYTEAEDILASNMDETQKIE